MKKGSFPFYPLIVAAFPVVSVFSANLAYVPVGHLWRPLFLTVGGTAIFAVALGLAVRNAARGAAGATVAVLAFFGYGWFERTVGLRLHVLNIDPVGCWAVVAAILVGLAAWGIKGAKALNVLAGFLALMATGNVGLRLFQAASLGARGPRAALKTATTGPRPDIVYIVLDGYGRSDAVKRAIGYDDSAFIEGLKKRGFYVASKSRANYCQTELSLSSSLNMDTVQALLPNVKPDTEERRPLAALVDDNEVARRLRARGYRFVAITSGFPPVTFDAADLVLRERSGGTMVESALLRMTPLGTRSNTVESQFTQRRQSLLTAFDNLASLAQPTIAPRFVVAHILAPHPPFVFGPNGEPSTRREMFGLFDGSDFMAYVGTPERYREGWAAQAEFVGKKVLESLDRILAGPGPKPIIVVQGDHGSKVGLDQNSLQKTDLHECFPILNAYLVPEAIRKELRPDVTPINTFRTILRGLFDDDLPPLPDRSWYSAYAKPYGFTDVTDRIELAPEKAERPSRKIPKGPMRVQKGGGE